MTTEVNALSHLREGLPFDTQFHASAPVLTGIEMNSEVNALSHLWHDVPFDTQESCRW
jgi:hypothetical protein